MAMEKDDHTTSTGSSATESALAKDWGDIINTPVDAKNVMAYLRKRQLEFVPEPEQDQSNKKDVRKAPTLTRGKKKGVRANSARHTS